MSKALFDDDLSEEEIDFKTNKDYAKTYNKYRQKELLKKLKDKEAGDGSESSSESDSSDEDETAYNPKFDEEFFKTLSSLKRKDPTIYDKSTKFFDEEMIDPDADDGESKKKEKKLTIKQYEQDLLLNTGGTFADDSDDDNVKSNKRPASPSYNEEQNLIKKEILGKVGNINESEDEDDIGGLFSKRQKTKKEEEEDDKEQAKWLNEHEELKEKSITEIWSNKKLSKDEKFLRDYILSNGYADKDDDEIPTYDEIVGDDDFEEKQTEFEHKYNFRFEDPDQEFIKRYPRTIENSVRKVDTRRKEKRVERRERKEIEKKEKFQEIEMFKELKRKEIEEKISQLKAVTGTDEINLDEMDLDGDFDPDEYDKKMQAIFNSEYYEVDEGDEKPEAPSDIEDLQVENYDEIGDDEQPRAGAHCEDDDFNMDCDYDESQRDQKKSFQDEMIESTQKRKRGKRKSKFMEMLESERPPFNPDDEKTFSEYLDEYYKLDCEDIVGDVKCRFKYVETTPCDYGLSIEEILGAKNKELNAWASLKKATQIRPEHVERNDQMIFQRKARNEALKRKILSSLYEPSDDEDEAEENPVVLVSNKPLTKIENSGSQNPDGRNAEKKKKKKKKKNKGNVSTEAGTSGAISQQVEGKMGENKEESKVEPSIEAPKQQSSNEIPLNSAPKEETSSPKPEPSVTVSKTKSNKQSKPETSKQQPKKELKVQPKQQLKQQTKQQPQSKEKSKPGAAQKQPNSVGNKTPIEKFKAKHKDPLKKVAHKTIDKKNNKSNQANKQKGLSDERLKAFGINPKKYVKQQKYAAQIAQKNGGNKNSVQAKQKEKVNIKMKNKLARALQKK
ncbi:protein KRI1 homolog [Sitodiplosis mosellana]|uniref:protein KRI1 homolog n=1 Tax=Sitodiplosis mosellana TaxID=263140 RepID=UPI002445170C|nr:protein KRI1 homolog [Sitodiplosis mosellana]